MSAARRLEDAVGRHAEQRPEARAVVSPGRSLSYGELESASNQLARALRAVGCRSGDRVGLLVPKSPEAIVGILGTYKADAVFVPLDVSSPVARLERILRSCEPRCVLAVPASAGKLHELAESGGLAGDTLVGWLADAPARAGGITAAFRAEDLRAQPRGRPPRRAAGTDAAHILYTSGSTGEPKGVVITHRNVIAFVDWALAHFGIGRDERLSGHSPLTFDLSTFDVFGALSAGAELHLVPPELNLLPHRLAEFIRSGELTQWFSVPSLLNYMTQFDVVEHGDFPALRRLLWCGETFPTAALAYWMQRLPHVSFTNLYGPTEATIASSYYDVPASPDPGGDPVPIGTACSDEELLILDAESRPAGPQEVGELYLAGVGLSPGYWRDPERTRAAFLPDPRNPSQRIYRTGDLAWKDARGLVHLVGRTDSQIKSRGYRIELGEIESALARSGLVREAVVTAVGSEGFEGSLICCAFAPQPQLSDGAAGLRRELSRLLPAYMLPARWRVWNPLPRNGSGKLDRRAVKEAFEHAEAAPTRRSASL